jgi:hypothetical protein
VVSVFNFTGGSNPQTWTFPNSFNSSPAIVGIGRGGSVWRGFTTSNESTTSTSVYIFDESFNDSSTAWNAIAFGTWT